MNSTISNKSFRFYLITFLAFVLFENSHGQCDLSQNIEFVAEIVARSSGNGLEEPLIAGEEVFIQISFNSDWDFMPRVLHGLIPTFGPGWDISKFDVEDYYPVYGVHRPEWFDVQGDCPPTLQKGIPDFCTYYDVNGNFQLCNLACETCPCSESMQQGDSLPDGWFWNFSTTQCDIFGDCIISQSWGPWGPFISHNGRKVNLDLLLTVANNYEQDSCEQKNDLSIGLQEVFDDMTGCYTNTDNSVSKKLIQKNWVVDCEIPPINNPFNKLSYVTYVDDNQDGVRDEDEEIIYYQNHVDLLGDSINGYSEQLQLYVLTGSNYTMVYDTSKLTDNYVLSTPMSVDVVFENGSTEKEVEFGMYKVLTSTDNLPENELYKTYPNPVASELTIQLPQGRHSIQLMDIKGLEIYISDVNNRSHTINTTDLVPGIYYLKIYDTKYNCTYQEKVIKY